MPRVCGLVDAKGVKCEEHTKDGRKRCPAHYTAKDYSTATICTNCGGPTLSRKGVCAICSTGSFQYSYRKDLLKRRLAAAVAAAAATPPE